MDKFSPYLTSVKLATSIVIDSSNMQIEKENVIPIKKNNKVKRKNLLFKKIVFKKGDNISNLISGYFDDKKNLKKFMNFNSKLPDGFKKILNLLENLSS